MSARERTRTTFVAVTAIFVVLSLSLAGLMAAYRVAVLEPRLRGEAVDHAEMLARSQVGPIAAALRTSDPARRAEAVNQALDELLLLRDTERDAPYFEAVALEVDYDVVPAPAGSLDARRGDASAAGGFPVSTAVYDPATSELLALARFHVSDAFFGQLRRDVRRELLWVTGAVQALLVLLWAALLVVLRKLQLQREGRLQAEAELSVQENRYERLVNSLSNYFMYRRDARGSVAFVSDSVRRVLGMAPDELLRGPAGSLTVPPDGGTITTMGERVFAIDVQDAEGKTHHLELSEVPVWDEAHRSISAWDGIARDATAQRILMQELEHARDHAEAASRAKSQFLANMSHEIRTPLNAILGMTGIALRQDAPPRLRHYLERIRGSGQMLAELVEDILDLARIEAGRVEIQREDFDLDDLLAQVAEVVGPRAVEKGLEVTFDIEPGLPRRLRGDPARLKQVLLNLLNNAVKFTERGEVLVTIAAADSRRDKAVLRFAVRDTGIGIPAEHLRGLFEPFQQVDASSTRRYGGAGLGLALSRRLVRMMGGELLAASSPGEGSTFSFDAELEIAQEHREPRVLAGELRGIPVLLADDHESARLALASMLEVLSCRVTAVSSGEDAVAAAEAAARAGRPFRLVLLDWKMPGLDGVATAHRLAALGGEPAAPIILVTAFDREEAVRHALEAGIRDVLPKPVSPSTLHDAVQQALAPDGVLRAGTERTAPTRFASGQQVLLVEDNAINREVAGELLRNAGLGVTEAHNGAEALALLDGARFDAVLMDVQMPVMDGVDAVRVIRSRPPLRDLPVIALTAHAMLGDRERFLAAGMSAYVSKPIDETELFTTLARWLRPEVGTAPSARVEVADGPAASPGGGAGVSPALKGDDGSAGVSRNAAGVSPALKGDDGSAGVPRNAAGVSPALEGDDGSAGVPRNDGSAGVPRNEGPAIPGYDTAAGLRRASGKEDLYRRLLASFGRDLDGARLRLREAYAANDVPAALHQLHTVKGTAATVGAMRLSREAAAIEAVLRRTPDARPALDAFEEALLEAREGALSLGGPLPTLPEAEAEGTDTPLDAELARAARPIARRLAENLAQGNLAATTTFSELKALLAPRLPAPLRDVEACLDRMDFEGAVAHVALLQQALTPPEAP